MAVTVTTTLADIAEAYSNLNSTTALRYLNQIHKALIEEFRLYTTTATFSSFDGTNREFAWTEGHVAVWSADWYDTSTSEPIPLDETSVDYLDEQEAGWRISGVTRPNRFYLWQNSTGGEVIGFDRIPTASTASYPQVRCVVSVHTDLGGSDSLPATAKTNAPWVSGVCSLWASRRDPKMAQYWREVYDFDKNELGTYVSRRQRRNPSELAPRYMGGVNAY